MWWCCGRTGPGTSGWWHITFPEMAKPYRYPKCGGICRRSCRSTWCRSIMWSWQSIPLTPNGKVDRKALPKPERDGASEQGYVAPRTETEQKIAAVWKEVLNREKVGVHDDFFELGGHSLLATQVMSRVNRLFNIQLPLRRLFEVRTVGGLAEHIASETQEEEESPISRYFTRRGACCFIFAGAVVVFIAAGAGECSLPHKRGRSA